MMLVMAKTNETETGKEMLKTMMVVMLSIQQRREKKTVMAGDQKEKGRSR